MSDIIDINIYPVVEDITLTIQPNLTTINVNTVGGGGATPTLNDVTNAGNETTNEIILTSSTSQTIISANSGFFHTNEDNVLSSLSGELSIIDIVNGTEIGLAPSTGLSLVTLSGGYKATVKADLITDSSKTHQLPNESGTLALTSDIPTNTSDLINDGDDGNPFISLLDLPSNIIFYPTNVASDISGYVKIVTSITDPDYNTTAVDVSTGAITTTSQLISSLATSPNIIVGNPGVFNITTIGNIRRTSGSGTASFYFQVYKRTSAGVETLIATSDNTIPVLDSGTYVEFSSTAIWNDGEFLATDRVVMKYYANRISGGSNPTYQFQFGGVTPVRTLVPIPLSVVPILTIDATPTDGSTNAVSSNGVFDELALKVDKTSWVDYSATSTIVGWSSFTTKYLTYKVIGDICTVQVHLEGTSNTTSATFTLPFNNTASVFNIPSVFIRNNSAYSNTVGALYIPNGSNIATCYVTFQSALWTGSGIKGIFLTFSYKIN